MPLKRRPKKVMKGRTNKEKLPKNHSYYRKTCLKCGKRKELRFGYCYQCVFGNKKPKIE